MCYQTGLLKLVSVSIFKYHEFKMRDIFSVDTQSSKHIVDSYFALSTRYVRSYVKEKVYDVPDTMGMYQILSHDGALCQIMSGLISIGRGKPNLVQWIKALRKKKVKEMRCLGGLTYGYVEDSVVLATFYGFSGSTFRKRLIGNDGTSIVTHIK